jgi:glycine oxidase
VNPRPLVQAFAQGAALKGAELHEATLVTGFVTEGKKVTGVRTTTRGAVSAGVVVLAAGAFSDSLSEQLGVRLPVYPLKGQLLVLHTRPVPIKANIWDSANSYVVPKRDGRVIVGATEEPDVYDRRTTLGGMAELSRVALRLVPKLAEASFVGTWGGCDRLPPLAARYSARWKVWRGSSWPPATFATVSCSPR